MTLFALTHHTGIRLAEVGFALAAIAGGLLVLSTLPGGRRAGMLLAGLALAAAGVVLVVATRWGGFGG